MKAAFLCCLLQNDTKIVWDSKTKLHGNVNYTYAYNTFTTESLCTADRQKHY